MRAWLVTSAALVLVLASGCGSKPSASEAPLDPLEGTPGSTEQIKDVFITPLDWRFDTDAIVRVDAAALKEVQVASERSRSVVLDVHVVEVVFEKDPDMVEVGPTGSLLVFEQTGLPGGGFVESMFKESMRSESLVFLYDTSREAEPYPARWNATSRFVLGGAQSGFVGALSSPDDSYSQLLRALTERVLGRAPTSNGDFVDLARRWATERRDVGEDGPIGREYAALVAPPTASERWYALPVEQRPLNMIDAPDEVKSQLLTRPTLIHVSGESAPEWTLIIRTTDGLLYAGTLMDSVTGLSAFAGTEWQVALRDRSKATELTIATVPASAWEPAFGAHIDIEVGRDGPGTGSSATVTLLSRAEFEGKLSESAVGGTACQAPEDNC